MTLSLTRPEVVWGGRRPVLAVGACPCWPDGPWQIFLKTSTNTVRLFQQILLEYDCVSKSIGSWVQFEIGLAETIRQGSLMADNQSPTTCLSYTIWLDLGLLRLAVFFILQKTAFWLFRSRLPLWQITKKERGIIGPASLLHGWQWVLFFSAFVIFYRELFVLGASVASQSWCSAPASLFVFYLLSDEVEVGFSNILLRYFYFWYHGQVCDQLSDLKNRVWEKMH